MSIRVAKYDWKNKREPTTEGYVNVLIHTTGELSPYVMKDDEGIIMENYWQFSKIWQKVKRQRQPVSRFQPNDIRWEHPEETHTDKDGSPNDAYWAWREKGFHHNRWVRYPAGFADHSKALGSIIGNKDSFKTMGYIKARKRIYIPKYKEIAIKTGEYKRLKGMLKRGVNLQIVEVDGPTWSEEYPYNKTVNGSIEIDEETLKALINSPVQALGHGYVLAGCLLGLL